MHFSSNLRRHITWARKLSQGQCSHTSLAKARRYKKPLRPEAELSQARWSRAQPGLLALWFHRLLQAVRAALPNHPLNRDLRDRQYDGLTMNVMPAVALRHAMSARQMSVKRSNRLRPVTLPHGVDRFRVGNVHLASDRIRIIGNPVASKLIAPIETLPTTSSASVYPPTQTAQEALSSRRCVEPLGGEKTVLPASASHGRYDGLALMLSERNKDQVSGTCWSQRHKRASVAPHDQRSNPIFAETDTAGEKRNAQEYADEETLVRMVIERLLHESTPLDAGFTPLPDPRLFPNYMGLGW